MLEIILLIFLCTKMGNILRAKSRKPLFMQVMVVLVWLVSMFTGALAYSLYVAFTRGIEAAENLGMFSAYPSALLAGAIGELFLFGIAWLIPARELVTETEMPLEPVADSQPYKPIG